MSKIKAVHYLLCFVLLFIMVSGLAASQVALAAQDYSRNSSSLPPGQEEPTIQEMLEIESKYPVLSAKSGEIFEFSVDLKYQGEERKRFDLTFTTPLLS